MYTVQCTIFVFVFELIYFFTKMDTILGKTYRMIYTDIWMRVPL